MMTGETIAGGAEKKACSDCGTVLELDVHRSAAGWYIGTWCGCGPYSRESGYYPSLEAADAALESGAFGR